MAADFDKDNIDGFEAKDTARKLPLGWTLLYIGLIVWGLYYISAYMPQTSGWTQSGAYEQTNKK